MSDGIRVRNDGEMVVLDLGDKGSWRIRPGAAKGLAALLERAARRAEVVRGPVSRGKLRGEDDARSRFDDILGKLSDVVKGER